MNALIVAGIILAAVLVLCVVALVFYRWGYEVRNTELDKAIRAQDMVRKHQPISWHGSDTLVSVPQVRKAAPTDDDMAERIASLVAVKVGAYTPPLGHEHLADDILSRLRALPMPIAHREVVEAIVLEHPGKHSPEWVAGTALQRTKTQATGEYRVLAVTEPPLLCLPDGEPVADEDWGYPGLGKELELVS